MLNDIKKTRDKVEYILAHYPETRKNNNLLCQLYWKKWDNLQSVDDLHKVTKAEAITRNKRYFQNEGLYDSQEGKDIRYYNEKEVRMGIHAI
ncbi:hypothetical protein [Priestia megaterium]|uniref:hypothetical protein n=1 Tax=Priestia megaterium TaxID=1404 RepID=UPI00112C2061|nr:hypothetical protein [Priestia megaterium]TPF18079.1 hypothetical protein CBE78_02295 [Priestia megaterium]TPF22186.1 hypothetical protein CBE79_04800 [Priestia megaterium]